MSGTGDDWLANQVAERRERAARLAVELRDLAGDAPAAGQRAEPERVVVPFRKPTGWPHPWKSSNKWFGGVWNAGTSWVGKPRILINNRSAQSPDDDDPTPPMAA